MYPNILFLLCSVSLVVAVPRDWSTFANDPMGSMSCKPTAQGDATQQAMIDCRKGLIGDKRDLSARMYIEGTCSSKEDYDEYYQKAYDKAKESCRSGHDTDPDDDDAQTDDDSTDSGDSWFS